MRGVDWPEPQPCNRLCLAQLRSWSYKRTSLKPLQTLSGDTTRTPYAMSCKRHTVVRYIHEYNVSANTMFPFFFVWHHRFHSFWPIEFKMSRFFVFCQKYVCQFVFVKSIFVKNMNVVLSKVCLSNKKVFCKKYVFQKSGLMFFQKQNELNMSEIRLFTFAWHIKKK